MNLYRHIRDKQSLEREYSPSSCVSDFRAVLDAYAARSEWARAQLGNCVEHHYGPSAAEVLDFFAAPSSSLAGRCEAARPVVVYIHGGYWQELSKKEHSFPATALNARGISYAALNYGLAPEATLDQMVDRCRRAILWIALQSAALAIDPLAIHVVGCSAGAHLAAMTALADWRRSRFDRCPVRSLILLSGVFDLRPLPLTYINDAVRLTAEDTLRNSPLLLVDAAAVDVPPALIAFGEHETAEFKRQSAEFAEALTRKGGSARLHEIRARNHFDLVFDLADDSTELGALALRHLNG